MAGSGVLGVGLLVFLGAAGLALMRAPAGDTTQAMRLAAFALGVTLFLGLALASWLIGLWTPDAPPDWLAGHVLWGLGGWVGVLVMGSAWQVVPMLQLTPPTAAADPLALARHAGGPAAGHPGARPLAEFVNSVGLILAAVLLIAFALATLRLQGLRKRKLSDVTWISGGSAWCA